MAHPFDEDKSVIRGCQWGVFSQPPPLLFVDVAAAVFVKAVEYLPCIKIGEAEGRSCSGSAGADVRPRVEGFRSPSEVCRLRCVHKSAHRWYQVAFVVRTCREKFLPPRDERLSCASRRTGSYCRNRVYRARLLERELWSARLHKPHLLYLHDAGSGEPVLALPCCRCFLPLSGCRCSLRRFLR